MSSLPSLRYLSVCSGIEAATVAWHPFGYQPVAFSEIEPFPCAVLKHHYPGVPNWGDLTKFKDWPDACRCDSRRQQRGPEAEGGRLDGRRSDVHAEHSGSTHDRPIADGARCEKCGGAIVDVLVGGTPCQSFSIAGLRAGLADPRGNLALTYLAVADRYRPRWVVWENVPGVLSSVSHSAPDPCPPPPPLDLGCDGAEVETEDEYRAEELHAFYAFVAGLSELGYGVSYAALDAQYFGLAQRRYRVFVVGYLGDWRPSAGVLIERESLQGHPAPRREPGQDAAPCLGAGPVSGGRKYGTDADSVRSLIPVSSTGDVAHCLNAEGMGRIDYETETLIAHALRGDGFDASEDGTGRGTPLVPIVGTLTGNGDAHSGFKDEHGLVPIVADTLRQHPRAGSNSLGAVVAGPVMSTYGKTLSRAGKEGGRIDNHAIQNAQVRRLTPRECERLQGFPDDYTLIPYRGKPAADGPRYKALGNSMAVPVMAWIGRRIALMNSLSDALKETA